MVSGSSNEPKQSAVVTRSSKGLPPADMSPHKLFDLTGRVALITGSSRGLGRAIAEGFALAGADIIVASRDGDACEVVAKELGATGRQTLAVACDVSKWDEVDRLVDACYATFGRVDVVVNNAGAVRRWPDLSAVRESDFDEALNLNLKGPFRLGALVGREMAKEQSGSIVNVSSMVSTRPKAMLGPFSAAKAGLNAITVALADAYAPHVRVNGLILGPFQTSAVAHMTERETDAMSTTRLLGRFGTESEVVGAALFLASDASSYVTGTLLRVDGGDR